MRITLKDDLPFVTAMITYHGMEVEIPDVLIDTGSASTLFAADAVAKVGITPQIQDPLYTLSGIGGMEVVFARQVERLQIEMYSVANFAIEVGGMDYGFEINGILGMDFLLQAKAIIDLCILELYFSTK